MRDVLCDHGYTSRLFEAVDQHHITVRLLQAVNSMFGCWSSQWQSNCVVGHESPVVGKSFSRTTNDQPRTTLLLLRIHGAEGIDKKIAMAWQFFGVIRALLSWSSTMLEPSGGEAVGRETNSTQVKPGGWSASTVTSKKTQRRM
jgi:hypothetical protein